MNRIWFGAALLIVMLALGLGSSAMVERAHRTQAEDLKHAAELVLEDNWKGAENFAAAARRSWERKQGWIAALSDHEPMDQIEGQFAQLEVFAKMRDAVSYSSTCRYLASQLEALSKSHSFNLQNLF